MFLISFLRAGNQLFSSILRTDSSYIKYLQNRRITLKAFRTKKNKPSPFPYEKKKLRLYHSFYDHVFSRFDENTKVVILDGQLSVGKHKIAKTIAEEFDMKFFPDITTDAMYINRYGYDLRNLDSQLPEAAQSYDEKRFNREPNHFLAATFQAHKYRLRFAQYYDALAHLMNTGQGVVLVRSPYSDCVFANAMFDCGYLSVPAKWAYKEIVRHTLMFLMRPHLVIYIGASPEASMENIKQKNLPYMLNSKALTPKFVSNIGRFYKNYIEEASINSRVLNYDWSNGGDIEVILEDIEQLEFDKKRHWTDPKFCDWHFENEDEMEELRYRYTEEKDEYMQYFQTPEVWDAPEMFISGNDDYLRTKVYEAAPTMEYDSEFNPLRGDNVWFKYNHKEKCEL